MEAELNLVSQLADKTKYSVDVGAHKGEYTDEMLSHSLGVISIEPLDFLYRELEKKYRENSNVDVLPYALSSSDGGARIITPVMLNRFKKQWRLRAMASLNPRITSYVSEHSDTFVGDESEIVRTRRLDSLDIAVVGLIKIDVEGHEEEVLAGAEHTLARDMPNIIIELEERHNPGVHSRVFSLLEGLGYSGFFLQDGELINVEGFDLKEMQIEPLEAIQHRITPNIPGYVNNFLFLEQST